MDVSGWTIDQRMRFPDWCFGNRQLIGCQVHCILADQYYFAISDVALPDPVCIWAFHFWVLTAGNMEGAFRIGLRATVPTNEAEMDTATEIFPYVGAPTAGPNKVRHAFRYTTPIMLPVRQGMVTGGLKLVGALYSTFADVRGDLVLEVSGLPTQMAGWLAHHKV